jgi:hypothetical protein
MLAEPVRAHALGVGSPQTDFFNPEDEDEDVDIDSEDDRDVMREPPPFDALGKKNLCFAWFDSC